MSYRFVIPMMLTGCLGWSPAAAQSPCPGLVSRLLSDNLRGGSEFATITAAITGCPQGAGTLLAVWQSPPAADADLSALAHATSQLRDVRLWEHVLTLAGNPQTSQTMRLAALSTLWSYMSPGSINPVAGLRTMDPFGPHAPLSGSVDTVRGASPMPANTVSRTQTLLHQLKGDPDPVIARAGKRVWELVTPLAPGEVRLVYLCANRFAVRNYGDRDLWIRWEVFGAGSGSTPAVTDEGMMHVGPKAPSVEYAESFFETYDRGTTRLDYYDQILQTVANPGTACTP